MAEMRDRLALFGGEPEVASPLQPYRSVGQAERDAVMAVMNSECLSGFMGAPGPQFFGGPQVQKLEAEWRKLYGCRHAVSMNSATSGLVAAMGAIGISPGDEVIVPPYTMSATAVAPLFYGGIPVFADINPTSLCIDPGDVERQITPKTRAILAVNLFGRPADLLALRSIADRHRLMLVEDSAQAPFARQNGKLCGTIGHIGVYSLNYHKHIHAGEGGICVTNDDSLANRLALIRNHGENVFGNLGESDPANLIGQNLRMTELSAAVALAQLGRIEHHLARRETAAHRLNAAVSQLEGMAAPVVPDGWRHNYYCWPLRISEAALGVRRQTVAAALKAEGMPFREGYVSPLYNLPTFQRRRAIGNDGWPFVLSNRSYTDSAWQCPNVELVESSQLLLFLLCAWEIDDSLVDGFVRALTKVHANLPALRSWERDTEAMSGD